MEIESREGDDLFNFVFCQMFHPTWQIWHQNWNRRNVPKLFSVICQIKKSIKYVTVYYIRYNTRKLKSPQYLDQKENSFELCFPCHVQFVFNLASLIFNEIESLKNRYRIILVLVISVSQFPFFWFDESKFSPYRIF